MDTLIELEPVKQTGHNCKITAIAAVEKYFAQTVRFTPIPLHKKKIDNNSIRQIAKTVGSRQEEILEAEQLTDIFTILGYETELIDFTDNFTTFSELVMSNIQKGNLVVACFAVDRYTADPSFFENDNEHAAVLHGFDNGHENITLTHWDKRRKTSLRNFYESSMSLPKERDPERYQNIKRTNKDKKYELIESKANDYDSIYNKKSITPRENSGFKGKLFVIKKPQLEKITAARQELLSKLEIIKLSKDLKIKINQVIKKGCKNNRYQKVKAIAESLNQQLENAEKMFLKNQITFEKFKSECLKAIAKAEPEFKQHRGWYKLNKIFRAFLGVLAGITIAPGLIIAATTKHGYTGTFFKTPPTDSEEKLVLFKISISNFACTSCM